MGIKLARNHTFHKKVGKSDEKLLAPEVTSETSSEEFDELMSKISVQEELRIMRTTWENMYEKVEMLESVLDFKNMELKRAADLKKVYEKEKHYLSVKNDSLSRDNSQLFEELERKKEQIEILVHTKNETVSEHNTFREERDRALRDRKVAVEELSMLRKELRRTALYRSRGYIHNDDK